MRLIKKTKFEKFYKKLGMELGMELGGGRYVRDKNPHSVGGRTMENLRYVYTPLSTVQLLHENFRLYFTEVNPNLIELHKIEVKEDHRGNGVGTRILNIVLDLIEEFELSLRLVPIYYLPGPYSDRIENLDKRLINQVIQNGIPNWKTLKNYNQLLKKEELFNRRMNIKLIEYYESFGFTRINSNSPFYIYENDQHQLVA